LNYAKYNFRFIFYLHSKRNFNFYNLFNFPKNIILCECFNSPEPIQYCVRYLKFNGLRGVLQRGEVFRIILVHLNTPAPNFKYLNWIKSKTVFFILNLGINYKCILYYNNTLWKMSIPILQSHYLPLKCLHNYD